MLAGILAVVVAGEHSAKPQMFLEMIEQYFPHLSKIEVNRRGTTRAGWDAWGNEAEIIDPAPLATMPAVLHCEPFDAATCVANRPS